MNTFEIDVQFYRQIEKFIEQLQSGTEHEENIFYLEHVIFKKNNFTPKKATKTLQLWWNWKPTSPGQMNIR